MSNLEIEMQRRGIPDALNDIISRGCSLIYRNIEFHSQRVT